LLTCAHAAWKSTSAPLLFCSSGEETVENLKISRGQLAPCQEKRIKRQQTVSSARCKVLAQNAGFLLASMPSYCRFKPVECSYSESVSVCVPQDKIRGSAIEPSEHQARSGHPTVSNTACAQQAGRGRRATRGSYHVRKNYVSSCRVRPATPDDSRPDCYQPHCGPLHRQRCAVHGLPTLQCYFTDFAGSRACMVAAAARRPPIAGMETPRRVGTLPQMGDRKGVAARSRR